MFSRRVFLSCLYFVFVLTFISSPAFARRESFIGLRDAPATYKGQAGYIVSVKDDESGLEFISLPAGTEGVSLDENVDTILGLTGQELSLDTQTANYVLAGPASGSAAVPSFRALAADDIPDLSGTYLTAEVDGSTTNEIEVADETFNATNFNGGTASAVSQDDFYDLWHGIDTDDDGDVDAMDATVWATKQAADLDLTTYAGITPSANIQSLLGSADYATARTNLGLAIGTDVQAYGATLADIADGTITEDLVNTANPWADNEVSDTLTIGALGSVDDAAIPAGISRDTEWNTEANVQTIWDANILLETEIDASTELAALMDDETGSGALVFGTSPTFTTSMLLTNGIVLRPAATTALHNIIWQLQNNDPAVNALVNAIVMANGHSDAGDKPTIVIDNVDLTLPLMSSLIFTDQDASPDTVGEFFYDNTVAGIDDGCFAWYDDDEARYIIDVDTLPTASEDDYVLAYDKDATKYYWKADANSGAATAWDDIADPDADATIAFAGFEQTITSTLDEASHSVLTITNTDADRAAATTILSLKDYDTGDAEATYLDCIADSDGTPASVFSINQSTGVVSTLPFDLGGASSFELPNQAASDLTLASLGQIGIDDTDDAIAWHDGANGEIAGEVQLSAIQHKTWSFDPDAVCDGAVDRVFMMTVGDDAPNGIIIDEWKVSFEADPTTEADLDLKYADAFIGVANAAVIDVCDTTTGAATEDTDANINSGAAVANGKVLYLEFGTAYTEANHQIIFEIWYHAEED